MYRYACYTFLSVYTHRHSLSNLGFQSPAMRRGSEVSPGPVQGCCKQSKFMLRSRLLWVILPLETVGVDFK